MHINFGIHFHQGTVCAKLVSTGWVFSVICTMEFCKNLWTANFFWNSTNFGSNSFKGKTNKNQTIQQKTEVSETLWNPLEFKSLWADFFNQVWLGSTAKEPPRPPSHENSPLKKQALNTGGIWFIWISYILSVILHWQVLAAVGCSKWLQSLTNGYQWFWHDVNGTRLHMLWIWCVLHKHNTSHNITQHKRTQPPQKTPSQKSGSLPKRHLFRVTLVLNSVCICQYKDTYTNIYRHMWHAVIYEMICAIMFLHQSTTCMMPDHSLPQTKYLCAKQTHHLYHLPILPTDLPGKSKSSQPFGRHPSKQQ